MNSVAINGIKLPGSQQHQQWVTSRTRSVHVREARPEGSPSEGTFWSLQLPRLGPFIWGLQSLTLPQPQTQTLPQPIILKVCSECLLGLQKVQSASVSPPWHSSHWALGRMSSTISGLHPWGIVTKNGSGHCQLSPRGGGQNWPQSRTIGLSDKVFEHKITCCFLKKLRPPQLTSPWMREALTFQILPMSTEERVYPGSKSNIFKPPAKQCFLMDNPLYVMVTLIRSLSLPFHGISCVMLGRRNQMHSKSRNTPICVQISKWSNKRTKKTLISHPNLDFNFKILEFLY